MVINWEPITHTNSNSTDAVLMENVSMKTGQVAVDLKELAVFIKDRLEYSVEEIGTILNYDFNATLADVYETIKWLVEEYEIEDEDAHKYVADLKGKVE